MFKISVIVPAYNCEELIKETLDCLLGQTLKEIQVVVVDDGSSDGTGAVVDEYARKDSRIVAVHKENGGVSSARNKGLEYAEGKYIIFNDSDDLYTPTSFEAVFNALEANSADLAVFNCSCFGFGGTQRNPIVEEFTKQKHIDCYDKRLLWNFIIGNKCYRADRLRESGVVFPPTRYSEDGAFFMQFVLKAKPEIVGVSDAEFLYRKRKPDEGVSVTQSVNTVLLNDFCTSLDIVYKAAERSFEDVDCACDDREAYLQEIIYKTYFTLINEFYRLLWRADDASLAFIAEKCNSLKKQMTPETLKKTEKLNTELGEPLPSRVEAASHALVSITVKGTPDEKFLCSLYRQSMPMFEVIADGVPTGFEKYENIFTDGRKPSGKPEVTLSGKKELDPRFVRVLLLMKRSPKFKLFPDCLIKLGAFVLLKLRK